VKEVPPEQLAQILARYRSIGITRGNELLLPPADALRLIGEAETSGIPVAIVSGWHYVDRDKGWIGEELETQLAIPDDILDRPDAVARSASLARDFIKHHLRPYTEFVTLFFDLS
jgi:hypothetical protein